MLKILLLSLLVISSNVIADEWDYERRLFVKVETDLKRGIRSSYIKHGNSLKDYPLYPYLVYQDYKRRISRLKDEDIIAFLEKNRNSIFADKLRYRWLKDQVRKGRWNMIAEHYISSQYVSDRSLACYYARALLHQQRIKEAREAILELWLVNYSQHSSCNYVFSQAKKKEIIGNDEIWQRILLVLPKRKGLASYLSKSLSQESKKDYRTLVQAIRNPLKVLSQIKTNKLKSSKYRDGLFHAFKKGQRNHPYKVSALWESSALKFKDYPIFQNDVKKALGLVAAYQLESEIAYNYLKEVPVSAHVEESYFWLVRSALRLRNWQDVLGAINKMPTYLQAYPQWRYWKARALKELGRVNEAQVIWTKLSKRGDYYGYLSADRIHSQYQLKKKESQYDVVVMKQVLELKPVQRIKEFIELNRVFSARREMNYLTNRLTPKMRIQLAILCRRWDWSSGVVQAMASDVLRSEIDLRFPMAYESLVNKEAKRHQIPRNWIYGLIRRESAFMAQIKSPAGAIGLMQLMPRTARSVARKLKIRRPSKSRLVNPSLNLRLGSAYIKHLYLKNNQNLPRSLAAYNAGQSRVKRWLNQTPVKDAEIWIDTIPFDETRLYVRAVLFYMTIYQYKLEGRVDRLQKFISI